MSEEDKKTEAGKILVATVDRLFDEGRALAERNKELEEENTAIRANLKPILQPIRTGRKMIDPDRPELDEMQITITAGDWFRLKILLGELDEDYLRNLLPHAVPSEEFFDSL